ncbi:MAG: saccharopine dehydrogenase NADP-binding domain-containing protein [Ignavibacteriales bacterium]|nr:saccharopine dehydrogenase NADP-binding domain-containing protein [Ignavibacteriales bacterium]
MKALVIGAGMMGSALAYDLAHSSGVEKVYLADIDFDRAESAAKTIGANVTPVKLDVNSHDDVVYVMEQVDVVCGATSYNHNLLLTKAAIETGKHFCDLGGNMDVVYRQMDLHEKAKAAGVLIIPNCGLAPGLAAILGAGGAKYFDAVDEIHLRVGGLPQHPVPPLNYQIVFSVEGLINEYLEPAEVIRNGKPQKVSSMDDLEEIEFPQPFGKVQAFNTSGGISTLTNMFNGKVKTLDYKTIRYKGHCEKFKTLLDLGFASSEPLMVGNSVKTARELFQELLKKKLPSSGHDLILMRVWIQGTKNKEQRTLTYEMIDYFDEKTKISSMMRTTSFPTSIIAQMIVNGTIKDRGVLPPEQCVPVQPLIEELKKRNIIIKESLK